MSNLASIQITVSKSVFKEIRKHLEGVFPELDTKLKFLPSAQVQVTFALPESETNEEILSDFLYMVGAYMRIFRKADRVAENLKKLDFSKTVTYGGIPVG